MDFSYTEEQNLLRDSVRKWVQDTYVFERRRRQLKEYGGFDPANWAQMAELGWLALPFAEEDGGLGGSLLDVTLLTESFGHGLVVEPYLANVMLAGNIIRRAGRPAQRAALLPGLIDGSRQFAMAHTEPGSRAALNAVEARAVRDGSGWRLAGEKALVLNGDVADTFVVVARTGGGTRDAGGISLFVVDGHAEGLSRRPFRTFDGFRAAELALNDVHVADDALLGEAGGGLAVLETVIDEATVALCAEAIGIMETLYKGTVEYTRTRKQFGVPIASFQVLQHRMADMFIQHEQARSLLLMAVIRLAEDDPVVARRAVSALKAYCGKAGRYIGQQSVQLHGGMGMTDEFVVGHAFKRLTAIDVMFGNEDFHLRRFAETA
ncbi:MAG: acyl-CoA dehydrogenase family protein [Gammaproteobacteria bacterium]